MKNIARTIFAAAVAMAAATFAAAESGVSLLGYNGAVGTSAEIVSPASTTTAIAMPTAGQTVYVASTSADDDVAGTGARTGTAWLVTEDLLVVEEDFELDGQTSVTLGDADSIIAVNRVELLTAGSGGTNAGVVYVGYGTNTSGNPANDLAVIAAGAMVTQQAFYMVPDGYVAAVDGWTVSSAGNTETTATLTARIRIMDTAGVARTARTTTVTPYAPVSETFASPRIATEGERIFVDAVNSAGSSAVAATVSITKRED